MPARSRGLLVFFVIGSSGWTGTPFSNALQIVHQALALAVTYLWLVNPRGICPVSSDSRYHDRRKNNKRKPTYQDGTHPGKTPGFQILPLIRRSYGENEPLILPCFLFVCPFAPTISQPAAKTIRLFRPVKPVTIQWKYGPQWGLTEDQRTLSLMPWAGDVMSELVAEVGWSYICSHTL